MTSENRHKHEVRVPPEVTEVPIERMAAVAWLLAPGRVARGQVRLMPEERQRRWDWMRRTPDPRPVSITVAAGQSTA